VLALVGANLSIQRPARAEGLQPANHVDWQMAPGEQYFETALGQSWFLPAGARIEKFQFSAIRFNLGYFQLKLLGVADFAKRHQKDIAASQKIIPQLSSLFELGSMQIYNAKPYDDILALVSAGFPASEGKPINLGLLKVDGMTQSQLLEDGPSAVLCLDSPAYQGQGFQFQLPTFYKADNESQQKLIAQCKDAVQIGPRIIEDPAATAKDNVTQISYSRTKSGKKEDVPVFLGIPQKMEVNRSAYFRSVIALDDPGSENNDKRSRSLARNGYIIVTETAVNLWELQNMLSSSNFYDNRNYAPNWALNMVGGDYAGLVVKLRDSKDPIKVGNTDIVQASMLAVVRRDP